MKAKYALVWNIKRIKLDLVAGSYARSILILVSLLPLSLSHASHPRSCVDLIAIYSTYYDLNHRSLSSLRRTTEMECIYNKMMTSVTPCIHSDVNINQQRFLHFEFLLQILSNEIGWCRLCVCSFVVSRV